MEDLPFSGEDYGTSNPSFNYSHQNLPPKQEPPDTDDVFSNDSPGTTAKIEAHKPTQNPSSAATFEADNQLVYETDSQKEELSINTPSQVASASLTFPEPTPESTQSFELTVSPSLPSSPSNLLPRRIASAEIDKPFRKPRAQTPSNRQYSPLLSLKQTNSPPMMPEQTPLKARFAYIDSSPAESPLKTPEESLLELRSDIEPSTSLDNLDYSLDSPSHGGQEGSVLLGDEEKESEDELLSDEEELLEVMAHCNAVFITFK